jgi:hypothetical protein
VLIGIISTGQYNFEFASKLGAIKANFSGRVTLGATVLPLANNTNFRLPVASRSVKLPQLKASESKYSIGRFTSGLVVHPTGSFQTQVLIDATVRGFDLSQFGTMILRAYDDDLFSGDIPSGTIDIDITKLSPYIADLMNKILGMYHDLTAMDFGGDLIGQGGTLVGPLAPLNGLFNITRHAAEYFQVATMVQESFNSYPLFDDVLLKLMQQKYGLSAYPNFDSIDVVGNWSNIANMIYGDHWTASDTQASSVRDSFDPEIIHSRPCDSNSSMQSLERNHNLLA